MNAGDLFASTASYYARHRPSYAPELIEHLRAIFQLDGTGRLLDLGCGTGQLAIPLAPFFSETVAIDPDEQMLQQGRLLEETTGPFNIKWVLGGSENLAEHSAVLRPLRLVTMGASFHWMDRDATLATLADLVGSGGGLAIVADSAARQSATGLNPWWDICLQVVRDWVGPQRRAGNGTYQGVGESHEQVLARSSFSRIESWRHESERERDIDSIVGLVYSTSYASPAVLANVRDRFEQDLRGRLLKLNPEGTFTEKVQVEAILAWLA